MLTSLPTEILYLIFDFLPIYSLKSLRHVCKAFNIIAPRLFSSSSFILHKELDFLYDLSEPSCSIAPCISTLHIRSHFYIPRPPQNDVERELSERLAPLVLPKLRNLETLR